MLISPSKAFLLFALPVSRYLPLGNIDVSSWLLDIVFFGGDIGKGKGNV